MRMILSRRQFMASILALVLMPRQALADRVVRLSAYHVNIGILFNLFTFTLDGSVHEEIDRAAGRYQVRISGEGSGITSRIESVGVLRERRFAPTVTTSFFSVRGRESRTRVSYDYDRRLVHYRHTSQTFFLGRQRIGEDDLEIPPGRTLDDVVSASLNHAEGLLERDGLQGYRTFVVRRKRSEREGPDDVEPGRYRAEIVPLRFTVIRDKETDRDVSLVDLTGFSSWARASHPARVTFGPDRRPDSIEASLILGTRFAITLQPSA